MKVKVSIGGNPFSGYLNIDPSPIIKDDKQNILLTNVKTLNDIEQAECEELIVDGVIDYISAENTLNIVGIWCSKLRHNGKITIIGTDINVITKKYINGELTTPDFNELLYGKCNHPWQFKSGMINVEELCEILISYDIEILERNIEDNKFIVIGKRK